MTISQQALSYQLAILTAGRNPRMDSAALSRFVSTPTPTTIATTGDPLNDSPVVVVDAQCFTGTGLDTANARRNRRIYITLTTPGFSDEYRLTVNSNDSDFTGGGTYASNKALFEAWAAQIISDLGSAGSVATDQVLSATVEGTDAAPVMVVELVGGKSVDSSRPTGTTAEWTVYRDPESYDLTLLGRLKQWGSSSTDSRAAATYQGFEELEGQQAIAIGGTQAGRGMLLRRIVAGIDQLLPVVSSVTGVSGDAAAGTSGGVTLIDQPWVAVLPCAVEGTL